MNALTPQEEQQLTTHFYAGARFTPSVSAYLAIAVAHAMKDPEFVKLYGTFAVEQIKEACEQ